MTELVYLSARDAATLAIVADHMIPPSDVHPGGAALGGVEYIDRALGAFAFEPPRIWAGGPYSGRFGGDASFHTFTPLTRLDELAWRTRIEGSRGRPEREWNGPVRGWQEIYSDALTVLGDLAGLDSDGVGARLAATDPAFRTLCYEHLCEGCYGAPEYGGNRDGRGWAVIDFPGDVQPRGYTDAEVSGRA